MCLRSAETFEGMQSSDGEAQRCAQHGVGDAGVAAGGVEQGLAGAELDRSAALWRRDDGGGCAVLDGAAGIAPLGLAEDLDAGEVRGEAVEPQQRRVADAVEQGDPKRAGGGNH